MGMQIYVKLSLSGQIKVHVSHSATGHTTKMQMWLDDLEVSSQTIEYFESLISEKQKQLEDFQKRIDYMKQNNIEEFDEQEYKIYCLLELLETKEFTRNQKVKLINEII